MKISMVGFYFSMTGSTASLLAFFIIIDALFANSVNQTKGLLILTLVLYFISFVLAVIVIKDTRQKLIELQNKTS